MWGIAFLRRGAGLCRGRLGAAPGEDRVLVLKLVSEGRKKERERARETKKKKRKVVTLKLMRT